MNIGEWTTQWAFLRPEKICLKYDDLELSYLAFNRRINQLAHAFQEQGIQPGDRVCVLMANSNVFLEVFFALAKLGGILVPLNFRLAAPELEYIINNAQPKLLFYSPEFVTVVDEFRASLASVEKCICETEEAAEGDQKYESWIAAYPDTEPVRESEPDMDDTLLIMYTSGTTGKPKGALQTHGNIQWTAIQGIQTYPIDASNVGVCCTPMFHIGGLNVSVIPNAYLGAKIIIQRLFDPVGVLRLIEENRATSVFGIPVMFLFMSQMPEFETTDFSSINFLVTGGSPCPKPLIETYQKKGVTFAQGYGLTESIGPITALLPDESADHIGSCGKPQFHTAVKIVDLAGNEAPVGETGEILAKGPIIFKGYWQRPEETAATLVDGWLHTGDMGYFDDQGFLYIYDRKKDMYISGGENVYPAEVEDVLMSIPGVADAGVIGVPDDKWGESGVAIIVKAPDSEISESVIIEACRGKLGKYKIPKKVVFTDELPRNLVGKILKKELREQFVGI